MTYILAALVILVYPIVTAIAVEMVRAFFDPHCGVREVLRALRFRREI